MGARALRRTVAALLLLAGCAAPPAEEASDAFVAAAPPVTLRDGWFDVPSPATAHEPPLTKEQALAVVLESTADESAVQSLEERPLGFALDPVALAWFAENGAGYEVVRYLRERARHEAPPPVRGAPDWPGPTEDASPLLDALIELAREKPPPPDEPPVAPPVRTGPAR